ncbi:MAG: hypothetical protein DRH21_06930 [Deltaproteobacteria bacterium]|nr:MAG: hypothetical protein DRH21_06930 [Deltaproteobacteria bacterium]
MIWILKVELLFGAYAEEEWEGTIEIESSSTLEDLHFALQDILNFDNDHMYEFYVSRTERSRDRIRYDDENGLIYDLTLEKLYPLGKNRKLFYLFDYGDHWLFKVTKSRKKAQDPIHGIEYPRLIEEVGIKPEQYPPWEE